MAIEGYMRWKVSETEAFVKEWKALGDSSEEAFYNLATAEGKPWRARDKKVFHSYNFMRQYLQMRERAFPPQPLVPVPEPPNTEVLQARIKELDDQLFQWQQRFYEYEREVEVSRQGGLEGLFRRMLREEVRRVIHEELGGAPCATQQAPEPAAQESVAVPDHAPAEPEAAEVAQEPKDGRVVVVVGPLPDQANSLQKSFPGLKIKGYKDEMPDVDRPDLIILMTKFLSHGLEDRVRAKYGKTIPDRIHRVHGGVTTIRNMISHLMGVLPVEVNGL